MNKAMLIVAPLLCGYGFSAHADSWTPSTRLSGPSFGSGSGVAIDAAGDAVATWSQRTTCGTNASCDLVWSRSRPKGGHWGPVSVVSTPDPVLHANATTVRMSEAGAATAFWTDDNGLNTADKPLSGAWTKPKLLMPGVTYASTLSVSEDRLGDIAVLADGVVTIRRGDGMWRKPADFAPPSVAHVRPDDVAISTSGDVVVSWESYDVRRVGRKNFPYNYVLHASRLRYGTTGWQDSGPLTANSSGPHGGLLAIDDRGRAGLSTQVDAPNTVRVQTPGGVWSKPTTVPLTGGRADAFSSDSAGDATLLYTDGYTGKAIPFDVPLATGTLSGQGPLNGHEPIAGYPLLAVSPSGSATVVWSYAPDSSMSPRTIVAVSRAGANAPWTSPTNISPVDVQDGEVGAVAAAGVGQSVVGWNDFDNALTYSRVNATVHRP